MRRRTGRCDRLRNVWESAERGRIIAQCSTFVGQNRRPGDAYSQSILVTRERTSAMSKSNLSRRLFLNRSVAMAGAGFAIGGTRSTGQVIGANDTIRVAIAGLNGRGGSHVDEYVKMPAVTLVPMEEHLKDNGVALDGLDYRLGRKLTFDAATESFEGDVEANSLLTRPYPRRSSCPSEWLDHDPWGKMDPACRWGFWIRAASGHACSDKSRRLDGITNVFAINNDRTTRKGLAFSRYGRSTIEIRAASYVHVRPISPSARARRGTPQSTCALQEVNRATQEG